MQQDKLLIYKARISLILLAIYDIIAANLAYGIALWLRFDFHLNDIPGDYMWGWFGFAPVFAILVVVVMGAFRLYGSIWKYVSYSEIVRW